MDKKNKEKKQGKERNQRAIDHFYWTNRVHEQQ
jgi:hypothetical protein